MAPLANKLRQKLAFNTSIVGYDVQNLVRTPGQFLPVRILETTQSVRALLNSTDPTFVPTVALTTESQQPGNETSFLWVGMRPPNAHNWDSMEASAVKKRSSVRDNSGCPLLKRDAAALQVIAFANQKSGVNFYSLIYPNSGLPTGYYTHVSEVFFFPEFRDDNLRTLQQRKAAWTSKVQTALRLHEQISRSSKSSESTRTAPGAEHDVLEEKTTSEDTAASTAGVELWTGVEGRLTFRPDISTPDMSSGMRMATTVPASIPKVDPAKEMGMKTRTSTSTVMFDTKQEPKTPEPPNIPTSDGTLKLARTILANQFQQMHAIDSLLQGTMETFEDSQISVTGASTLINLWTKHGVNEKVDSGKLLSAVLNRSDAQALQACLEPVAALVNKHTTVMQDLFELLIQEAGSADMDGSGIDKMVD
jgi:hypothetical protein